MFIGTVVGNVWATKKERTLEGFRFLMVRPYTLHGEKASEVIVAADVIGAGIGETVLVVVGRAARHTLGKGQDVGYQTAIVAIVDSMSIEGGEPFLP